MMMPGKRRVLPCLHPTAFLAPWCEHSGRWHWHHTESLAWPTPAAYSPLRGSPWTERTPEAPDTETKHQQGYIAATLTPVMTNTSSDTLSSTVTGQCHCDRLRSREHRHEGDQWLDLNWPYYGSISLWWSLRCEQWQSHWGGRCTPAPGAREPFLGWPPTWRRSHPPWLETHSSLKRREEKL